MPGYPIELDLRGKTVLVVGLGPVGRRKAAGLLAAGATVVGIDPEPAPGQVPEGVEIRAQAYRAEHLRGMSLVLASASAEVNRRVVADAREAGVWVGSASDPETGDFRVPAVWRDGALTVAVSTSGGSPALAAALRDRVAQGFGPAAAGLAALLAEFRPTVFARLSDSDARRRLLADWGNQRWLDLWLAQGPDAVRRQLTEELARASAEAAVGEFHQSPLPPGEGGRMSGEELDL